MTDIFIYFFTEKRSREEILFGNQQNKPSGLVDDLMGMSDNEDDTEQTESNKNDVIKFAPPQGVSLNYLPSPSSFVLLFQLLYVYLLTYS